VGCIHCTLYRQVRQLDWLSECIAPMGAESVRYVLIDYECVYDDRGNNRDDYQSYYESLFCFYNYCIYGYYVVTFVW